MNSKRFQCGAIEKCWAVMMIRYVFNVRSIYQAGAAATFRAGAANTAGAA